MLSVAAAQKLIEKTIVPVTPVAVELTQAWGQVLAEAIVATMDSPPFDKSMMDGYAVRSSDTPQAGQSLRVVERIMAGQVPQQTLQPGEAIQVMTGAPIPQGAEAVVPVEQVQELDSETIRLAVEQVPVGRHILRQGESMRVGDELLAPGQRLAFPHIGLLAELGHSPVSVFPQPTVAVLATGDELVPYSQQPGPGQIRNTNEPMLVAQIQSAGVLFLAQGIARDDRDELRSKLQAGLAADFLLLTGGVSAGVLDLVPQILQECGVAEVFHKVNLKPGKPIWFGQSEPDSTGKRCFVFGLPGNPVSSLVCFELFVKPALRRWRGEAVAIPAPLLAELTQPHLVKGDRPVYHPARSVLQAGKLQVTPVAWGGSGDLRGTASADGMLLLEPRAERYEAGEQVPFWSWGD